MFISAITNVLEMTDDLFYFSSGIVCFDICTFNQILLSGKYFLIKDEHKKKSIKCLLSVAWSPVMDGPVLQKGLGMF